MESTTISELMKRVLTHPDFRYVYGSSIVYGRELLKVMSVIDGSVEGDFVMYDNLGGRAFDVMVNTPQFPESVAAFVKMLKKEHPGWIIAYRIDGVENKDNLAKHFGRYL